MASISSRVSEAFAVFTRPFFSAAGSMVSIIVRFITSAKSAQFHAAAREAFRAHPQQEKLQTVTGWTAPLHRLSR